MRQSTSIAIYPTANADGNDQPLDGKNRYVLTFPKGALPPVNYFWSLTMYDAKTQVPIHNPIKRVSANGAKRDWQ